MYYQNPTDDTINSEMEHVKTQACAFVVHPHFL